MNTGSLASLKAYFLPILAVIVVAALLPLFIMPSVTTIQTDYQKSQDQQKLKGQLDDKIAKLAKLDNKTNLDILNSKIEPAIPTNPDPAGLLGTLEQVAFASGSTAKSSTYAQAGVGSADSGEISADLVIEGPYSSIAQFVSRSENSSRLVAINTMRLSVPSTGGDTVSATFNVSSPYENVSNLGSAETPLPADLTNSPTFTKVSNLNRIPYSPTQSSLITGKDNPF